MHFEILIEDRSGKEALENILPKILNENCTYQIHAYKGIGRIPQGLNPKNDPAKRILLNSLPNLIQGYGKTFKSYPPDYPASLIVICDLDSNNRTDFLQELNSILTAINPQPSTRFCLAIEEGEAWFLGDIPAILEAYPNAKKNVLENYINDSICGTWETLADAVCKGGSQELKKKGWQEIGKNKSEWSHKIAPRMNPDQNKSPSFQFLRHTLLELAGE